MNKTELVTLVLAAVGIVGLFVLLAREQLARRRDMDSVIDINKALMEQHDRILEHLMIASDPDAWREKQVDNFRKERDARREKEPVTSGESPPKRGVG